MPNEELYELFESYLDENFTKETATKFVADVIAWANKWGIPVELN